MEDAYEIGIRLVLENGVSAGIAALQNDLAAYDRALAATTGRLRTMTEAGHRLAAPFGAAVAGRAVPGPAKGEETASPDAEPERRWQASPSAMPPPVAKLPPVAVAFMPAMSPPASSPLPMATASAPAMPQVVESGCAAGRFDPALRSPAAPEPLTRPVTDGRQEGVFSGRALTKNAAVTVLAVPPPRYARYAPVLPGGQPPPVAATPVPEVPEMPDGRPVTMPAPNRRDRQQVLSAARELFVSPAWGTTPPDPQPASAGAQAPARPANAQAAMAVAAAPVAAAAASGPTQGDVFLDGSRVGRWMSDRLAREVDRPQAGVTGFDPRLGPAWPGSLHGT